LPDRAILNTLTNEQWHQFNRQVEKRYLFAEQ
jgi:hypothetical protein